MEDDLALDALLSTVVDQFEEYTDTTSAWRENAAQAVDYFHGEQLTAEEKSTLEKRKQPIVVFNEIKPRVITMQGLEKQTRKDPKAWPRNPGDEAAAHAATDAIRFVCDLARWDEKRSQAAWELAVPGTAAIMVGVRENRGVIDPDIRRISWDRFYYDPASCDFDFADASYMGAATWMNLEDAIAAYPEAEEALDSTWQNARDGDALADKPKSGLWGDYKRKRVRLCEHYWKKKGEWYFCIFTKGGFMVEPQPSPYLDDEGKPECPIKAVSLYVGGDNERYGEVRAMISPQDEVNKRRSKALHLLSQRQVRVSPNVTQKPDLVRAELSRPDGVFIGDQGEVEVLQTGDLAAGNLALMQDARLHIHRMGANNALAGKDVQNQSGRAITAQQQGGMTEIATYLDIIRSLSLAVYRSAWARIRQHWDAERWVRITDDERNLRFVGFNRPVTALEAAAKKLGVDPKQPDKADPQALQLLEAFSRDPRAQEVVGTENVPAEIDIDIVVDEGMDTPSLQAEQFDQLVKMLPAFGPYAQHPKVLKLVIEASSLRNKERLIEVLEPDGQEIDPAAQMQAQAQQAMAMAQQEAQLQGQIEMGKAQVKAQSDVEVAKIKAQTDLAIAQEKQRMEAMLAEEKARADMAIAQMKAQTEAAVKLEQQRVDALLEHNRAMASANTEREVDEVTGASKRRAEEQANGQATAEAIAALAGAVAELAKPKVKVPVRNAEGFIVEVREEAA